MSFRAVRTFRAPSVDPRANNQQEPQRQGRQGQSQKTRDPLPDGLLGDDPLAPGGEPGAPLQFQSVTGCGQIGRVDAGRRPGVVGQVANARIEVLHACHGVGREQILALACALGHQPDGDFRVGNGPSRDTWLGVGGIPGAADVRCAGDRLGRRQFDAVEHLFQHQGRHDPPAFGESRRQSGKIEASNSAA